MSRNLHHEVVSAPPKEFSNPIIKDRIEIIEDSASMLRFRTYLLPGGGQSAMHFHARIVERFQVITGALTVQVGKEELVLKAGASHAILPFVKHRFYNPSASVVVFEVEIANPQNMLRALQIMYGLANAGKTNEKGMPLKILHTAIGVHMMDAFAANIPYFIQKPGIVLLATLGKWFGVERKLLDQYCL